MIIGKSLTALGGGGLKPEIRVTAQAGALLNLYYKDSSIILQSYQLGAEETQHTFVVSVSEMAYVVEDVTNSASVEVLVDVVARYDVEIEYEVYLIKDGYFKSGITYAIDKNTGVTYTLEPVHMNVTGNRNFSLKITLPFTVDGLQKLKMSVIGGGDSSQKISVGYTDIWTTPTRCTQVNCNTLSTTTPKILEFDVSQYSGTQYVYITFVGYTVGAYGSVDVIDVWFE